MKTVRTVVTTLLAYPSFLFADPVVGERKGREKEKHDNVAIYTTKEYHFHCHQSTSSSAYE